MSCGGCRFVYAGGGGGTRLAGVYPGDDEWGGEVCAAHQSQAPVGFAAVTPQRHHECMQSPHAGSVALRTRAVSADCVSTAATRDVVRAKLASPFVLPLPAPSAHAYV
jgi:hypothetical protein